MSFAAEIKDFLAAYTAVSGVLTEQARTKLAEGTAASQNNYRDWLMGAQDRENAGIIDFAKGNTMAPLGGDAKFPSSGSAGGSGGAATNFNGDPSDLEAIVQSANNIGANPRDYIALMNKESGIDPGRWGGAGGDYLGLIQFGENERAQFGVNDRQTIKEQLPAVEAFFKARGYKPGMDIAHMYSIVNAGSLDDNGNPRWDASDGPGSTVRSHVNDIIKNHFPVADRLLAEYTSLSPEGQVAELSAPAIDDLGTSDPIYRAQKARDDAGLAGGEAEDVLAQGDAGGGSDIINLPAAGKPADAADVAQAEEAVYNEAGELVTPPAAPASTPTLEEYYRTEEDRLSRLEYQLDIVKTDNARDPRIPALEAEIKSGWEALANVTETGVVPTAPVGGGAPATPAPTDSGPHSRGYPVAPVVDDLGTSDPAYRQHVADRPVTTVDAPVPGGPSTAEVPGTEPVSEPAIPEEAASAPRAMGFDPLPQTSGHTDAVSRAGSADEVQRAMDTPVDHKGMFKGIFDFARGVFGAKGAGAIDTDEDDPGGEAFAAGVGGANTDLVKQLEQVVEQRYPGISQDEKSLRVMSIMWNWGMRKGKPNPGAAFAIYQTYKQIAQKTLALAQAAAGEGSFDEAIQFFQQAYDLVPDGEVTAFDRNADGTYNITTKDAAGNVVNKDYNLDPKQIVSHIMEITPDQFDHMVESQFIDKPPADASTGFSEVLGGYGDATGGEPAVAPDEAIPTTPDGEEPVSTTGADVTMPPGGDIPFVEIPAGSEAVVPGEETAGEDLPGVEAPAALPPTSAPTVRPVPEAPTEPMNPQEFRQYLTDSKIPDKYIAPLTAIWEQDRKQWDDYIKSLPTAESLQALDAYNAFFKEMQAVPLTEFFDTSQSSIAGIGDEKLMGIAQRVADARNEEFKRLTGAADTEGKEAADTRSLQQRQDIEREMYAPDAPMPPSQPVTPGPMAPDYRIGTQTAVPSGEAAIPEEEFSYPAGADAGLNREDYDALTNDRDTKNAAIVTRNKERFAPRAPLDLTSPDAVAQIGNIVTTTMPKFWADTARGVENITDPEAKAQATAIANLLQANVAKYDLNSRASGAVLEMMRTPGNEGLVEDEAVSSIMSMFTVFPDDPTMAPYTAKHINDPNEPAGLVEVTVMGSEPFRIPLSVYNRIDEVRAKMASDQRDTGPATRAANDLAAEQAATTQTATEAANKRLDDYSRGVDELNPSPDYLTPAPITEEEYYRGVQ